MMFRLQARQDRGQEKSRGQALVEFALIVPIFLLLFFGLIDVGRAVYVNNSLAEAAREGARWGSVQSRSSSPAGRDSIEAEALSRLVSVPGATATATCIYSGPPISCRVEDRVSVTVETDLEMITPIIAQLMSSIGANPLHLEATSDVVVQN